jgi:hypothetical protein
MPCFVVGPSCPVKTERLSEQAVSPSTFFAPLSPGLLVAWIQALTYLQITS